MGRSAPTDLLSPDVGDAGPDALPGRIGQPLFASGIRADISREGEECLHGGLPGLEHRQRFSHGGPAIDLANWTLHHLNVNYSRIDQMARDWTRRPSGASGPLASLGGPVELDDLDALEPSAFVFAPDAAGRTTWHPR